MFDILHTLPFPTAVLKNGVLVFYNKAWATWVAECEHLPKDFLLKGFHITKYAEARPESLYLQTLLKGLEILGQGATSHTQEIEIKSGKHLITLSLYFSRREASDEIVIIHQNIDEHKQISRALSAEQDLRREGEAQAKQSQDTFNAFFELFPDLFGVCNAQGQMQQVNAAWESLLGEIVPLQTDFYSFIHAEDVEMARRNISKTLSSGTLKSYTNRVMSARNGAEYWITWNGIFNPDNQLLYLTGRDVTLVFDSQAKLVDLLSKLQELNSDFVELNEELINKQTALNKSLAEKQGILLNLQRSEALYRSITNFTPGYSFIILDKNFRYLLADGKGLSSLGLSKEQLLGKDIFEAHTREQLASILPRYHRMMRGEVVESTYWQDSKFFEEVAIPIFDEQAKVQLGIIIIHENTEKKQAEKEIYFQASVLQNVKDAIVVTNLNGDIIYYNKGAENTFGYTPDEMLGKSIEKLYPKPVLQTETHTKPLFNTLTHQKDFAGEWQTFHKNGKPVWVEITTTCLLDSSKNPTAFIGIAKDITDRKIAEEQLIRSNRELTNKNDHLSQYAYVTSHNLRAPIARILGLLDLFDTNNMNEPFNTEIIQKVKSVTRNLDDIIRDLVSITDIQHKPEVKTEEINLNNLIETVLTSLRDKIDSIAAKIKIDISSTPTITSVRPYLQSIIFNLISNALKYHDPMKQTYISICTQKQDNQIVITVNDNGLGMDLNLVGDKVFGFYKRFHAHTEGKGLGLYMVRKQVEALEGRITVESRPYQGSTFTVVLPQKTRC